MKTISRLPLNALRVFDAVVRYGSMARAADALNVQPSAVSMQMKNLADYIGLPLIVKRGRGIQLTANGERILPAVVGGLGQIDEAIDALRQLTKDRPFTLSVLPSFLHLWLMPLLADFERQHPSFRLQVLATRELADFGRGGVDAAVRLGNGNWPGLKSVKLMAESLVPVCSPALSERIGRLRSGVLPRGVALLESSVDPWTRWSESAKVRAKPSVVIDDALAVVTAAENGRGLALARSSLVVASVKAGKLVVVGDPIPYRWSYYWVTRPSADLDSRSTVLEAWLKRQAGHLAMQPG